VIQDKRTCREELAIPTWIGENHHAARAFERALLQIREEESERLARPEDYPPPPSAGVRVPPQAASSYGAHGHLGRILDVVVGDRRLKGET
jgi:hypothetical protein